MLGRLALIPIFWGSLAALSGICVMACGDDEESAPDGGGVSAGGRGGRGGSGGAGGSGITPLPDEIAGKACASDKQCGTGSCLHMLPGAFGGADVPAPDGYCSGECLTSADCGDGGACAGAFAGLAGGIGAIRGRCLSACTQSTDCRNGYRCVNALGLPVTAMTMNAGIPANLLGTNTCQPAPETDKLADGEVGRMCAADVDCGDGRCMRMNAGTTYPGGYCTGRCLQDADCGANGSCMAGLAGGAGTCFLRCSGDSDCERENYRCRSSGGSMLCVPGAAPLPDDVVGRACGGDADCGNAAMSCSTRLGRYAAPGGYCTQRCVNASDCGAGGVCVGGRTGTASGTCYRGCSGGSDCRDGYTCGPAGNTGSAAMQNICSVTPPPSSEDAGI